LTDNKYKDDQLPGHAIDIMMIIIIIIIWTIAELEDLDRKTRKLMTAHRTPNPQSDIDRLYLELEEERQLMSFALKMC